LTVVYKNDKVHTYFGASIQHDAGFKIEFSENIYRPKRVMIMARVSRKDKEALQEVFIAIKNEINLKRLFKTYAFEAVNVEVPVVETTSSNKPKWLGKLARLWDVKKTSYENQKLLAFQRSDSDSIAMLVNGEILTARTLYRPFRRVDFDTLDSAEYQRLLKYGMDWYREVSNR
jgi:hypothetical protein